MIAFGRERPRAGSWVGHGGTQASGGTRLSSELAMLLLSLGASTGQLSGLAGKVVEPVAPKLLSEQGCPCEGHPKMESRPRGWVSSSWKRILGKSQCFQGGQEGRRPRREFLSAAGAVAQQLLGARGEAQGRCTHVRDDLTGRSVLCPSLPAPRSPSP